MNSHPWTHFLSDNDSVDYHTQSTGTFNRQERLVTTNNNNYNTTKGLLHHSSNNNNMAAADTTTSLFGDAASTTASFSDNHQTSRNAPRRNLQEAFEELYIETPNQVVATPSTSSKDQPEVSPTGVAEIHLVSDSECRDSPETASNVHQVTLMNNDEEDDLPHFELHSSLQRDLSQALVNRVSFYGVIHDINKEANSMATCDTSSFARSTQDDLDEEDFSPLVVAVNGSPSRPMPTSSASTLVDAAVIDEEKWLLQAIESRGEEESRSIAACPPTFLQAMGEREYILTNMEASRTQLWKPSRSWWEAKSGKNPWIEPTSHNKRWR